MSSRVEARQRLIAIDTAHRNSPTVDAAIQKCAAMLRQHTATPYEKAITGAMLAGSIALLLDDAWVEPAVQDSIHELDQVGPILRAAADLYDALYRAGRN